MGQNSDKFESDVLPKLAKESDEAERKLLPRIRRLYALSWVHTQAGMELEANVKPDDKIAMPPADLQTLRVWARGCGHLRPASGRTARCSLSDFLSVSRAIQQRAEH